MAKSIETRLDRLQDELQENQDWVDEALSPEEEEQLEAEVQAVVRAFENVYKVKFTEQELDEWRTSMRRSWGTRHIMYEHLKKVYGRDLVDDQ